jgi:general secretion pathway protein A
MAALSQYLLTEGAEGKTVVVILDEAQQMSIGALEQIRILSTLETATRKLLQIVLVGQPELEEKLQRRELRQLDQRIGIRCFLKPLSRKETFRYIEHRLRIAGLPGALPFARGALARIYKHSGGIPRVINLVCDRALTAAFSARAREISPALVKAAIVSLQGQRHKRRWGRPNRILPSIARHLIPVAAGLAGILVVGAAAATAYRSGWGPTIFQSLSRPFASTPQARQVDASEAQTAARVTPRTSVKFPTAPPGVEGTRNPESTAIAQDGLRGLLARLLTLWGVNEDLSAQAVGAWPTSADGAPDVPAVAARYQLSATWLPETTLAELWAVNLPAIVEMNDGSVRRPYLLRSLDNKAATLTSPKGEDTRVAIDTLDASWGHSAWVIWRNVDLLPADPQQELTPIVVATVALRLQKLGLLSPPLPTGNSERFQEAVRRFQSSMGLTPDGIVGPRTTLTLSRVVAGRFSPTLAGK